VLRDLLAQGVQRLRQIISAPLDIGPPGGRVGGGQPVGRFGDAHRVMQGRAYKIWAPAMAETLRAAGFPPGSAQGGL